MANETSLSGISGREDKRTRDNSHSNQNSGKLEMIANGTEISRKSFRKNPNIVQFPKCKPIRSKSQNSHGTEILKKSIFTKIWVYGLRGVSGKCCSIRSWKCRKLRPDFFCLHGKAPLVLRLKNNNIIIRKDIQLFQQNRKWLPWKCRSTATIGGSTSKKWYQSKTKTWCLQWPSNAVWFQPIIIYNKRKLIRSL